MQLSVENLDFLADVYQLGTKFWRGHDFKKWNTEDRIQFF